jgi:hypothetical protein
MPSLVDVRVLDRDASAGLLDAALHAAHPGDDRISRDGMIDFSYVGIRPWLPEGGPNRT